MGLGEFLKENRSTILTALTAIGVVTTSVLTGRSQMKVDQMLLDEKKVTKKQVIKAYAPAVVAGVATIGVAIAECVTTKEEKKHLTELLAATEASFAAYRGYIKKKDPELDADAIEYAKEPEVIERYITNETPNRITIVEPLMRGTPNELQFTIDEVDFYIARHAVNRRFQINGAAEYEDFLSDLTGFRVEGCNAAWDMEYVVEATETPFIEMDLILRDDGRYDIDFGKTPPTVSQYENMMWKITDKEMNLYED